MILHDLWMSICENLNQYWQVGWASSPATVLALHGDPTHCWFQRPDWRKLTGLWGWSESLRGGRDLAFSEEVLLVYCYRKLPGGPSSVSLSGLHFTCCRKQSTYFIYKPDLTILLKADTNAWPLRPDSEIALPKSLVIILLSYPWDIYPSVCCLCLRVFLYVHTYSTYSANYEFSNSINFLSFGCRPFLGPLMVSVDVV